jgi:hypothetical protein
MPLEQLLQQQKLMLPAAPAAPATNSSPGRLTGQVNGRSGAEWPAVVTYGYWERHPRSDLAMLARSPGLNGHTRFVTGVGPMAFPGASPRKLVSDLRRPPGAGERVAAELADDALGQRDRDMFQVVGRLGPGPRAHQAGMDAMARQLDQPYGEEAPTLIVRHVRLTAGGRIVPIREQDLEMFPERPLVLLGLFLPGTLCLAVLTGLAFSLLPALLAARAGLTPALHEGGGIGTRRHSGLCNARTLRQVAGLLALLLITACLVAGFRGTAGVGFGFDPRNLDLISPDPVRNGYSDEPSVPFCQKVVDRVRSSPLADSASLTEAVPLGAIFHGAVTLPAAGAAPANSRAIQSAGLFIAAKDHFDLPLLPMPRGRDFHKEDEADRAAEQLLRQYLLQE